MPNVLATAFLREICEQPADDGLRLEVQRLKG